MDIIEFILNLLKPLLALWGITKPKSQEELEKGREEKIKIEEENQAELEKEQIEQEKRAVAIRYAHALDYAVTLEYYFRGYGDSRYPEYVRTYEKGIISRKEYNKLKKADPDSIHLVTYCNVLNRKIARGCFDFGLWDNRQDSEYNWLKWDLKAGYPGRNYSSIFYNMGCRTSKNTAIDSAKKGLIKELTCKEAQERANCGIYICGINNGHEIVVYPDLENEYDDTRGCKIAQAGWYNISNVYISGKECWGTNWKNKDIHFFEFPYEGLGFVDYLNLEEV